MRIMKVAVLLMGAVLVAAPVGCGDDDDDLSGPSNAPSDHTVVQDGVRHAAGLRDPLSNCAGCHGADLRGGDDGQPSCYSCHGKKWP